MFLNKRKKIVSVDGIKLESIQVAASYTEREDPRKTPTILANVKYSSTVVICEIFCLSAFLFLELGRRLLTLLISSDRLWK